MGGLSPVACTSLKLECRLSLSASRIGAMG